MKENLFLIGTSSPRRKNILLNNKKINLLLKDYNFIFYAPKFNEDELKEKVNKLLNKSKSNYSLLLSKFKLEYILNNLSLILKEININYKDLIILTSDTSIIYKNKIYNKPIDLNDNRRMLIEFSNNKHKVITGYSLFINNKIIVNKDISYVYFNKLNIDTINNYINTLIGLDKAGGYSYQDDYKFNLIKKIKGDKENIVGLPIKKINEDIKKYLNQ